jgi:hypothetical protein
MLIVAIAGLALLFGCSKFSSQQRMNLNPFAEDMIAIAGDIQYGLGESQIIYTRQYSGTPEAQELGAMLIKVRSLIRGIIAYAIEVVTVADFKKSGPEKAVALSQHLDGLLRPALAAPKPQLNISIEKLDAIIADVRSQKTLLDALGAAQPIIDEVARVSGELFGDTKTVLDATIRAIQKLIDSDIRPVLDADKFLRAAQVKATLDLRLLSARHNNPAAIDSLLASQPAMREFVDTSDGISSDELRAIEDRFAWGLRSIREIRDQLRPDVELYWRQQQELETLTASYNQALRQARVAVLAWSRAHARLAAGVSDPAEINVLGLARKAAGGISPLP